MSQSKIQKNDTVMLLCGKDKGKTGKVLKVSGDSVLVEGINMLTHYIKRDPQRGIEGALKKKEAPVHISNVGYYDEEVKKVAKIGFKVLSDGKKIRYNKRTKNEVGKS